MFGCSARVVSRAYDRWGVTVYLAGLDVPDECPEFVAWGCPVGSEGDAPAREAIDAIRQPTLARSLGGSFVLAGPGEDDFRLLTSPNFVRLLYRLRSGGSTVFATKALAAHLVAGVAPRLNRDVVPELVFGDFVTGELDLLADTQVVEDGSVIRVSACGVHEDSYWPLDERLAAGPATDAPTLRTVIGAEAGRMARVTGAQLGLTAGRDSTLILSCLAEQGQPVETFTLDSPWHRESAGAAAAAAAVGVLHEAPMAQWTSPCFESFVEASRWTEGHVSARNLYVQEYDWRDRDVVWLSGHGGELGRTRYLPYIDATERHHADGWRTLLLDPYERVIDTAAYRALEQHLSHAMSDAASLRGSVLGMLDMFYLRQRLAKWPHHQPYLSYFAGTVPVLLSPAIVNALLNIPEPERASGAVYDKALALGEPNLHAVATEAIRAAFGLPASTPRTSTPTRLTRLTHRLVARAYRRNGTSPAWQLIEPYLDQLQPDRSFVVDVLGPRWLTRAMEIGRTPAGEPHRRHLWSALAIEALARFLHTDGANRSKRDLATHKAAPLS